MPARTSSTGSDTSDEWLLDDIIRTLAVRIDGGDFLTMKLTEDVLSALVAVAQDAVLAERVAGVPAIDPLPGDLVVAVELLPRSNGSLDPDAIGFLMAHGRSAYRLDGTGPTRETWAIRTFRHDIQSWENVTFARVPARIHALVTALLDAP